MPYPISFIMSGYDIFHHVMSCHISSQNVMLRYILAIMSHHDVSYLLVSCYDIFHHVITYHTSYLSCRVMVYLIMSYHVISQVVSCVFTIPQATIHQSQIPITFTKSVMSYINTTCHVMIHSITSLSSHPLHYIYIHSHPTTLMGFPH
jgi:hypothetical protein